MPSAAKPPITATTKALAGVLRAEAGRASASQTWLAEQVRISQPRVSKILAGKSAPNMDELVALCRALKVSVHAVTLQAEEQVEADLRARLNTSERDALDEAIRRTSTDDPTPEWRHRQERGTGS